MAQTIDRPLDQLDAELARLGRFAGSLDGPCTRHKVPAGEPCWSKDRGDGVDGVCGRRWRRGHVDAINENSAKLTRQQIAAQKARCADQRDARDRRRGTRKAA